MSWYFAFKLKNFLIFDFDPFCASVKLQLFVPLFSPKCANLFMTEYDLQQHCSVQMQSDHSIATLVVLIFKMCIIHTQQWPIFENFAAAFISNIFFCCFVFCLHNLKNFEASSVFLCALTLQKTTPMLWGFTVLPNLLLDLIETS